MFAIREEKQIIDFEKLMLVKMSDYSGICNNCGTPIEAHFDIYAIKIGEKDSQDLFIPLTLFKCPSCLRTMQLLRLYKSLDISKELESIKNENTGSRSKRKKQDQSG